MNNNINESIIYLFHEYERLKLKSKNHQLTTNEEKQILEKLASFLGKKNEK